MMAGMRYRAGDNSPSCTRPEAHSSLPYCSGMGREEPGRRRRLPGEGHNKPDSDDGLFYFLPPAGLGCRGYSLLRTE